MKHRNEQSGIDKQGRLKTKRKPAHRHQNNHAPKTQVTKMRAIQIGGERTGATMTHEEFARTVRTEEEQRKQEARTLPLGHGESQVEATSPTQGNVEAEFYEGEPKIQPEVGKITDEPSEVGDELKNKTHSPVESAMAE
jgi:hypothetical protein